MTPYSQYTDERLLHLLKNGHESAFTELYDRYWERLYASACKKFADREQAKEIVHDVFLDIWKRREQLTIRHLPAYLEKAVRFRIINYVTRDQPPAFFDLLHVLTHSPYETDQLLLAKEFMELVEAWIEALPEKRRQVFVRYYFQQLSTKEIAQELNISHKTVQNQLSISLQYLRSRFGHLLSLLLLMEPFIMGNNR